ncbi:hypothetical protein [Escherichia coli]|uniref:hypothetical protein n=1 Tax=Escherichia coli TaxID=562 RepID=UPI001260FD47|nr:hypothetical protein [Escherichia coli]
MKPLFALAVLATATITTGCTTTTPAFMNEAVVGDINGRTLVLFPVNGGKEYRPQFSSDCQPMLLGEERPSTGSCIIAADRLTNIHSFEEHKAHGPHKNTTKIVDRSNNYGTEFEFSKPTNYIDDNL